MPYRLIVSDMDDTLLNERGLLSPATIEAIEAARAAGAELVLASGRMPCAMRSFSKELKVTLPMIAYNGAEENAFDIRTGTPILVTGRNLAFIDGDSVTVSRMADGAEVVLATLVPDESDYYHESFAWPSGLDGLDAGAEVKFTFRLRGGDREATPVVVSKPVTVNAGATPPAPTGPELTGVHAPGIESPMIRVESGVWFDGTGLDGWTAGRDSIWCKNNRAEEAEFVRMDGDGTGAAVEFDGGMLKADEGAWSVLTDLGIVEGSEVRFKVTINGQSAEIVGTVAEA